MYAWTERHAKIGFIKIYAKVRFTNVIIAILYTMLCENIYMDWNWNLRIQPWNCKWKRNCNFTGHMYVETRIWVDRSNQAKSPVYSKARRYIAPRIQILLGIPFALQNNLFQIHSQPNVAEIFSNEWLSAERLLHPQI